MHMYIFNTIFHYSLSYDIEYCYLCYTVEPCCLSLTKYTCKYKIIVKKFVQRREWERKNFFSLNLVRIPVYNKHSKVYNAANNEVWLYEIF